MSTPIPPPPSEQPKRRPWVAHHKILTGLGVVIVLAIIGGISSGSHGPSTTTTNVGNTTTSGAATQADTGDHPPADDVTITACQIDDLGYVTATVQVTNHSSKASNYMVTVAVDTKDGSTQIGTGDAYVSHLEPGQSASDDANTLQTAPQGADLVCRVADVTRFAAG